MTEVLAKHPNIKILATVDGHWVVDKSMTAMSDVLTAHGDNIDIIDSPSGDQQIMGAERVLKQRNVTRNIVLIGQGVASSGSVACGKEQGGKPGPAAGNHGPIAVELAGKNLKGEQIPEIMNLMGQSPVGNWATPESLKDHPEFKGELA